MKILCASNRSNFLVQLGDRYPGRLGNLVDYSGAVRPPLPQLSVAMDNRKFVCWSKGINWDWEKWYRCIHRYYERGHALDWLIVPDEVANRDETLRLWKYWQPRLVGFGYPLAFAVQDGMHEEDVPDTAHTVFIGGTMDWKLGTLKYWCDRFPRVHVGRVNNWNNLWLCHVAGAESCDSSAWFLKGDNPHKNLEPLLRYLVCSNSHALAAKWEAQYKPKLEILEENWLNRPNQLSLF